jgi:drug/metabolite transporter (DMT)-like permease
MAVSAFWFSLMSLGVKVAGRRLPSQEVVLVRGVVTLALSWAVLRSAGLAVRVPGRTRQYTNPLWAAALAAVVLGERVGAREALALAAGLAGVVLVVGPGLAHARGAGVGAWAAAVGLLGAVCSAAAYVVIRRMGAAEDARRVTLYLPLVTVPATLPTALPGWVWPTSREWLVLAGIGASTQLAQTYMTRGLQRERAARATAVGYLQLVFAAAWGWLAFGDRPGVWTAAGAATIVAGTLALALRPAGASAATGRGEPPPAATASAAETAEVP